MKLRIEATVPEERKPKSGVVFLLALLFALLEIVVGVALVLSSWHHSVVATLIGLTIFIAWTGRRRLFG